MKIEAIIFDLDGTLLNTIGDLADSVNEALRKFGFPALSEAEVQQRVGNGVKRLVAQSLPENLSEEMQEACFAAFSAAYEDRMMVRTRPYAGIVHLLHELQKRQVRVGVLSNKYDAAAKALVSHYFGDLCEATIGEIQGMPRKPDPTLAFALLEQLHADAAKTLYVGDSDTDMMTAKNAGLAAVGVSWGFRDAEVLLQGGADIIVHEAEEILQLCETGISKKNS